MLDAAPTSTSHDRRRGVAEQGLSHMPRSSSFTALRRGLSQNLGGSHFGARPYDGLSRNTSPKLWTTARFLLNTHNSRLTGGDELATRGGLAFLRYLADRVDGRR